MEIQFTQIFVLGVVVFLVYALYRELFNPAFTFFISVVALLLVGVLTPTDILKGLSNQQIIIIFVLVLVTAGIRVIYGSELFTRFFNPNLKPRGFLLRMMLAVSSISAFLNNTPIVAFMIPYVKDWAERTGHSSSKFLIPLSFSTILGGMITVIGTSTNLVLSGLMAENNLPLLEFTDFLYLGIIVCIVGGVYLYFIGYKLLPDNKNKIDALRENLKEYIVETEIHATSPLVNKTVKEAGLRKLQDVFLVEIVRNGKVISPVSPGEVLEENDTLFFSGNTASIYNLIKDDNGLELPKQQHLETNGHFNFVEAVIPAGSDMIGQRIRDSDFRSKFNSSIIAIHRDGKRLPGRVGEMELSGGDFLLLLAGDNLDRVRAEKDLYFVSAPRKVNTTRPRWHKWLGLGCFLLLIIGVVGVLPLFEVSLVILVGLILTGILNLTEIKRQLDLNLLMVLVCSLAVGVSLQKSGAADLLAQLIIDGGKYLGNVGILSALFVVTVLLTSLITNAAAVSIMFPIALALAQQLSLPTTPFFIAIAFAASGDFMTPIGYQTNLMVYGPGGYTFKDFLKVGIPLTFIYVVICIAFISYYYNLI